MLNQFQLLYWDDYHITIHNPDPLVANIYKCYSLWLQLACDGSENKLREAPGWENCCWWQRMESVEIVDAMDAGDVAEAFANRSRGEKRTATLNQPTLNWMLCVSHNSFAWCSWLNQLCWNDITFYFSSWNYQLMLNNWVYKKFKTQF